jgi:hypothetical protein
MGSQNPDLQEIHDFLVDLGKQAGEIITQATSQHAENVDSKMNCTIYRPNSFY